MSWAARGSRAARTPASRPCAKGAGLRVLPCDKEIGNAGPVLKRIHTATFHLHSILDCHNVVKKRLASEMELPSYIPAQTLTFHFSANEHPEKEQPPLGARLLA